ncbi:secretory carrier-associated membrane protein 1-like isoform X2 [Macrosteles quadrilineatus]|uniref:secretory carrier-associated membrane protein 1-like isoform X2 n=1 Tax=Macrosteles quadrilineatus TaxID=74068 RepID=UPI0023E241E7|nr:secretory carrier-associated membrane protein 1-like isoform X2 [Macrosteles quadrilineatus]XP_054288717.1 secretory carrier-associated membrane protein 1-like isoform X2 [Macrosteles quadrilineatus]
MSGFDDNPFGEPTVDNPFADPSVTQVTKHATNATQGLEDYNPFADQAPQRNAAPVRGAANPPYQPSSQPAIMQPTQEVAPPAYAKTAQQTQPQQLSAAEFQRRQEELERKAAELARREEELRNAPYNVRRNNWPPLPENNCCGLQPCFYQDINVEIPVEFQPIVRNLYYLWMFHAALMVINVIGGLLLILHNADFSTFGVGVIYTLIFTPFSFICWYRPIYKAFRSDSSFNFMVFFFIFFFQMVITIFQALGLPGAGTCGLATALKTFDGTPSGIVIGIFLLLVAAGFCCAAFIDFLLLAKVHRIYRSTGASFAKAQQEFTSEIMRNQHVRDAAGNIVSSAVQSQFNQPRQPSSRY